MEGASRSDVPITVVHTTYRGRESLGRGHKQCFQERLLMFKKINIFYGVQFAVSLVFLNDYLSQNSDRTKKNRTVFEHSRFIFAATLSVDRNAIKLFQFVMNKKTPEGAYAGFVGLRKNYGYVGWKWKLSSVCNKCVQERRRCSVKD